MQIVRDIQEQQEEQRRQRQIEQARRQGHSFIRVRCKDSAFSRMHAVHDIIPYMTRDESGQEKWNFKPGARILECFEDQLSGDLIQDVLDDGFNRQFLAKHVDYYEVVDSKLREEVAALINVPYTIEESEISSIDEEIEKLQKKRATLKKTEDEKKTSVEVDKKKQKQDRMAHARSVRVARRKQLSDDLNKQEANGNNESTANVDRA